MAVLVVLLLLPTAAAALVGRPMVECIRPLPNEAAVGRAGHVRSSEGASDGSKSKVQKAIASSSWQALSAELDRLPVFTVANQEGQPLQYEIDGSPTALFYADVEAAKKELTSAREMFPELNCDLIPVGVGSAFKLQEEGKAALLPAAADLTAAGAPAGTSALGQPLPLFACMEMSQQAEGGKPVLPIFMAWSDCAQAVSQATQDGADEKLEIVGLSLPSVVERLGNVVDGEEPPAFAFIPSASSAKFIGEYLENSGGQASAGLST
jgi:hypothetical protein